jgi:hypothetical protein
MTIIKDYIMSKRRKTTIKNKFHYKKDYSDLLELFKQLDKKDKKNAHI